jgi:hypothetical protein
MRVLIAVFNNHFFHPRMTDITISHYYRHQIIMIDVM